MAHSAREQITGRRDAPRVRTEINLKEEPLIRARSAPRLAHPPNHTLKNQSPTARATGTAAATAYGSQARFFIGMARRQNTPLQGMTAPQSWRTYRGSARLGDHQAFAFR
jgi:hypothetical protein